MSKPRILTDAEVSQWQMAVSQGVFGSSFQYNPPVGTSLSDVFTTLKHWQTRATTAEAALAELRTWRDVVSCGRGCQCDPPGSGEEHCVGTCQANASLADATRERGALADLLSTIAHFDELEAESLGCDTGNPDGGSSDDCPHCHLMRRVGEIRAALAALEVGENTKGETP